MEDTRIDIEYVAALARLELSEEQLPKLRKDLESIVGYIASLSELDLAGRRTDRACGRADERLARGRGGAVVRP